MPAAVPLPGWGHPSASPPGARSALSILRMPHGADAPVPPASAESRSPHDAKGSRCFPADQTIAGDTASSLTGFMLRTNQENPLAHSPELPSFCGLLPLPQQIIKSRFPFFFPNFSVYLSARAGSGLDFPEQNKRQCVCASGKQNLDSFLRERKEGEGKCHETHLLFCFSFTACQLSQFTPPEENMLPKKKNSLSTSSYFSKMQFNERLQPELTLCCEASQSLKRFGARTN